VATEDLTRVLDEAGALRIPPPPLIPAGFSREARVRAVCARRLTAALSPRKSMSVSRSPMLACMPRWRTNGAPSRHSVVLNDRKSETRHYLPRARLRPRQQWEWRSSCILTLGRAERGERPVARAVAEALNTP
jgi:hypothetical protein